MIRIRFPRTAWVILIYGNKANNGIGLCSLVWLCFAVQPENPDSNRGKSRETVINLFQLILKAGKIVPDYLIPDPGPTQCWGKADPGFC